MNSTRRLNGAALRVIRQAYGTKAKDLAARADIDPGYLTKLEQGSRQPSPPTMLKLAQGLGVPLEAISYPTAALEVAA